MQSNLTSLTRLRYRGAVGDSLLSSYVFSASDRNSSECGLRLSKYGYRAEINKNIQSSVTNSAGEFGYS